MQANDDKIDAMWIERIGHGSWPILPRNPCNFGNYHPKAEIHLNTRSKAIGRESFCTRHNHRDFLTISWNIWAICLRDERRPAGCLTARFILSFFFLFLPTVRYAILYDRQRPGTFIATTAKIANISEVSKFPTCGMNYRHPSWFMPIS